MAYEHWSADAFIALLARDPYRVLDELREREGVTWVEPLRAWYVTRYEEARAVLRDDQAFAVGWETSTIHDTFGENMLTTDGALHDRYRQSAAPAFMPSRIRGRLDNAMREAARALVDTFAHGDHVEVRGSYASRLPIQTMLIAFGLPPGGEPLLRRWYDDFERALANMAHDLSVRESAKASVREFHAYLDQNIRVLRSTGRNDTLLGEMVNGTEGSRLEDAALRRNLSIIFFGGISTVEALILNTLWALLNHPHELARVREQPDRLPKVLDEVMRWLTPVQSAVRHATRDVQIGSAHIRRGDVVACMLGAANRDAAMFAEADKFQPDRSNSGAHLGFATGPHMCIGFRLAKAEATAAVETLLQAFPEVELDCAASSPPEGHEFYQPRSLTIRRGRP
jgi:cytochrome P450